MPHLSKNGKSTLVMKLEIAPYETFRNRSIISMQDFTRAEIESILDFTKLLETSPNSFSLKGKLMASCFFEPSTRTRLSFESAMKKLGGDVIGFSEAQSTSIKKKETLYDTIRMIEHYADLIVIRHPVDGSAAHARATTQKPVINAGDGSNQHPTQTLLDLYTIRETQGRLDQLHIAICGDLKHARTSRSLIQATAHFNMRMYFVPLPGMEPSRQICDELKQRGILFSFHPQLSDIIAKLDIVYMRAFKRKGSQKASLNL